MSCVRNQVSIVGRSSPRSLVAAVVSLLLAVGCGGGAGGSSAGPTGGGASPEGVVLVFAAASLTDAFGGLEVAFEAANPGVDVQLNLAGSSTLREQILAGAPADVFASASPEIMADVVAAGEVDGQPAILGRNRMAIAVPAGNPAEIAGLADLADDGLLIGLCAEAVPCGRLARSVLANAGVEPAVDTNEPDVRALLTKIAAGELDAGIVYTTDLAGADVDGIVIGADHNVTADYPIAPLVGGDNPTGAAAFVAFARSEEGQAILADHGFDPR